MRLVRADLHIHTALSPCAADEMTPGAIVAAACEAGLGLIAVCDHNSAGNVAAVEATARGLTVLAGMEITTAEEAHIVGLFPNSEAARGAAAGVLDSLPPADDEYERFFGEQWLFTGDGSLHTSEKKALAMASALPLDDAIALIRAHDGLVIAAHIDRPHSGVVGQLGLFPGDAGFDAIELSRHAPAGSAAAEAAGAHGLPIVRGSDSHFLADIGSVTTGLWVEEPTFAEFALALAGRDGRGLADA